MSLSLEATNLDDRGQNKVGDDCCCKEQEELSCSLQVNLYIHVEAFNVHENLNFNVTMVMIDC